MLKNRTCERDLIAATHVCQHWRSTLIGDSSLWTPPIKSGPYIHRLITYIERSEWTDEIKVDVTSLRDLDTLQYLTPYIVRLRSFTIQSYRNSVMRLPDDFLGHHALSLRSVSLTGACLAFESPFPPPNLTRFHLHLYEGGGPVSISALFQFFSNSPLLESISIFAGGQTTEDVLMDQVISLESLVELFYTCNVAGRVLPFLEPPCLKSLQVRILQEPGEVHKLVDVLPHNSDMLLAKVTMMVYRPDPSSPSLSFISPGGPSLLFIIKRHTPLNVVDAASDPILADWFPSQACIPFGQINTLGIDAPTTSVIFPTDVFVWENLKNLEVDVQNAEDIGRILLSFHPDPGRGVPCPSLRTIKCTCRGFPGPLLEPLMSLVKERKGVGCQLRVVHLPIAREFDPHYLEELREHVGKVQIEE